MEYELIRSGRRTLGLEVRGDRVIVRAPLRASRRSIEQFVREHETWIAGKLARSAAAAAAQGTEKLSPNEVQALAAKARQVIPERAAEFAARLGVDYGRITIRAQRTRWGSCSAKGNLSFNCLLMLTPPEVLDSVVAHEVCHRKEMNHSPRFYAEVYRVFPDYDRCRRWLRDNGGALLNRLPDGDQ